ncbi:MAG: hypothetical protein AAF731_17615 [Bacteroidota bacterium]
MKKIYLIIVSSLIAFLVNSIVIGQEDDDNSCGSGGGTAPDGETYTNNCNTFINGVNGIDCWTAWFHDPDGDCKSDNWYVVYYYLDGSSTFSTDETWRSRGMTNVEIDFDNWNCFSGGITYYECEWEFNEVLRILEIDFQGCSGGEYD